MKTEQREEYADKVINMLENESLNNKEIRRILGSAYLKMGKIVHAEEDADAKEDKE